MKMTGKEYFGNEETFRRMVHSFADEIVSRYTGEKGIAGTRIAFVSDKTRNKELYVMDYDGQNALKVSADHSICLSPAWSPDGKMLAYVSYRDRNPDLYALNMETGKRWKISGNEGLNISPAWSPNGKRLAAALTKDGAAEIYLMDQNGREQERLTYGAYDNVAPAWSPNGQGDSVYLGKSRNAAGLHHEQRRHRCAPRHLRRLLQRVSQLVAPWRPHRVRKPGAWPVQDRDGESRTAATSGSSPRDRATTRILSWSPSGRQIVFSSNRSGKSGIYMMNADGVGSRAADPERCQLHLARRGRRNRPRGNSGTRHPRQEKPPGIREVRGNSMDSQHPSTIILVEDDAGHAVLIEKNLRRAGIGNQIIVLDNGRKALDFLFQAGRLQRQPPACPSSRPA